jgi:cell division protein FtsN
MKSTQSAGRSVSKQSDAITISRRPAVVSLFLSRTNGTTTTLNNTTTTDADKPDNNQRHTFLRMDCRSRPQQQQQQQTWAARRPSSRVRTAAPPSHGLAPPHVAKPRPARTIDREQATAITAAAAAAAPSPTTSAPAAAAAMPSSLPTMSTPPTHTIALLSRSAGATASSP